MDQSVQRQGGVRCDCTAAAAMPIWTHPDGDWNTMHCGYDVWRRAVVLSWLAMLPACSDGAATADGIRFDSAEQAARYTQAAARVQAAPDHSAVPFEGRPFVYKALGDTTADAACDITVEGLTTNCHIVRQTGDPDNDPEILRVLSSERYVPARKNGIVVEEHDHTYHFAIARKCQPIAMADLARMGARAKEDAIRAACTGRAIKPAGAG